MRRIGKFIGRLVNAAIIFAAANVIAKILGAVFKIPLTYILKEEGKLPLFLI